MKYQNRFRFVKPLAGGARFFHMTTPWAFPAGVLLCAVSLMGQTAPPAPQPQPASLPQQNGSNVALLAKGLREITLDPQETYKVRDFRLNRGDVTIYLSDGVISFTTPVGGRRTAAVFVTHDSDFGDAELLLMPARRGERAALLHFTNTPNLDEHFDSAVFLFTDGTYEELHKHMVENGIEPSSDLAETMGKTWNVAVRNLSSDIEIRLLDALVNQRGTDGDFFNAVIGGRQLGAFDVIYDRQSREAVALGKVKVEDGRPAFQLWSSFTPRRPERSHGGDVHLANYRIDTKVGEDLRQSTETQVDVETQAPNTRGVSFLISDRMKVISALVDGEPAETYQRNSLHTTGEDPALSPFLVVAKDVLSVAKAHTFTIRAEGTVVRHEGTHGYYVADRNAWFPHREPEPAQFDLTFHLPSHYRIVSIGDLVEEHVADGERTMRRRTATKARFAGFNLGEYEELAVDHGPYRIECFANRNLIQAVKGQDYPPDTSHGGGSGSAEASDQAGANQQAGDDLVKQRLGEISARTGELLDRYTAEWGQLPIRSLAVSPIPAFIGQGFPGLVYLSSLAYLHENERPPALQNRMSDVFFTDILLAHEVAHQWWGNVVSPADYHSDWIFEALANTAALDLLEKNHGAALHAEVLESFRNDLLTPSKDGGVVESIGPIELGYRLRDMAGAEGWQINKLGFRLGDSSSLEAWRIITYEKGTWILHMLRRRMGDEAFRQMLKKFATEYAGREVTNEDFRALAASYIPAGMPDPKLEGFFDSWVYSTGVPNLKLNMGGPGRGKNATRSVEIKVAGVADDFVMDVPITVSPHAGQPHVEWVRCTADGGNLEIPRDATAQLPSHEDFLYAP